MHNVDVLRTPCLYHGTEYRSLPKRLAVCMKQSRTNWEALKRFGQFVALEFTIYL